MLDGIMRGESEPVFSEPAVIPEWSHLDIADNDIPPANPEVSIEAELDEYNSWALESWDDEISRQELVQTEEYESQLESTRDENGNIDWKETWIALGRDLPTRDEVFPNNEDANLTDDEVYYKLNDYLIESDSSLHLMAGVNIEEYPEVLDPKIREMGVGINKSDWARTRESGVGSREFINEEGEVEENTRGFQRADITLMLDRRDPRSQKFFKDLNSSMVKMKEKYPNIQLIGRNMEAYEDLDVTMVTFGVDIRPSMKWRRDKMNKEGEDYFDDVPIDPETRNPGIIKTELPNMKDYSDPKEYAKDYAKAYRRFNYERNLFHQYTKRFNEKHKDFFQSKEAEEITDNFFKRVEVSFRKADNIQ